MTSPKRHCMVVHHHYPLGEPRVKREAEALLAHGIDVDIVCLGAPKEADTEVVHGVRVYRLPVYRGCYGASLAQQFREYLTFFWLAMITLIRLHRRQPYQVVQVHNLPDFLIFAAWYPKLKGAKLILDLHDLMPEFFTERTGKTFTHWSVRLVQWQERLACRFADQVITVSEHWRQTLIRRGVAAHKCSVVMNVADERIFLMPQDDPCPAPTTGLRLIYHGTIVRRYGLDLALHAVAQLRQELPDIHLTILGKGDDVERLIQLTHELELQQHVAIHNEIRPVEELPTIIRQANVGIVPYRNDRFTDQLLPTKLMEYAALGMPAIAARTTAIDAYFRDTMAELFEPGNVDDLVACMRRLSQCPARWAELAQGCREFNERYNWTKLGAEYVALVERLHSR